MSGRYSSAKVEPFGDIPNRLLTVPAQEADAEERRQRLQAAASLTEAPLLTDDTAAST